MKLRNLFLFIQLFLSVSLFAGNTDSLLNILAGEKEDSIKMMLMLDIGDAYETVNPDSQLYYYRQVEKMSSPLAEKDFQYKFIYSAALSYIGVYYTGKGDMDEAYRYFNLSMKYGKQLTEEKDTTAVKKGYKRIATALLNIAGVNYYKGNYTGAIDNYLAALYMNKLLKDNNSVALCINNIGLIYLAQGMYQKAMSSFQEAVAMWRGLIGAKDEKLTVEINKRLSLGLINMGIIQRNLKKFDEAIDYYQQALDIRKTLNDPKGLSECFLNMGVAYKHMGDYEKAFLYYDKALYIFEKQGDMKAIMKTNNNIGSLLSENKDWVKALGYFETAMKIAVEAGDKQAIANISNNISGLYLGQKDFARSLEMGQKALAVSDSIGNLPEKVKAFFYLMESYAAKGNYKEAYENAKNHILLKDSLQSSETLKAMEEMEARYQAEKKQQEIDKQKLVIKRNDEEIKRKDAEAAFQKILIISLSAGIALLLVLAWIIYRSYVNKKRSHKEISVKNSLLEQANTEISAQRDEISAQRDSIDNQKKHIQKILDEHIDSIRYAQRIQKALIPATDILDEVMFQKKSCINEYSVYFRPKDIVSGDFYWAARIENRLIFCVADCTGHGVPGAFMSMLGVSYLNEIVKRHNVITASDILNELRASIVVSLRQQKAEDGTAVKEFNPEIPMHKDALHAVKDGMDIALCVLNTDTKELQFAGANNSLFIIRSAVTHWPVAVGTVSSEAAGQWPVAGTTRQRTAFQPTIDDRLMELKGDKMPIGVYLRMQPFGMQTVQMQKDDVIYLMSDGYTDQFGGTDYKKFSSKRFRNMLQTNAHEPLVKQKEILDSTFNEWKGVYQQLDDICIMALRIS